MNNLIPMFVVVPLGMAFILPMLPGKIRWVPDAAGNLTLFVLMVMAFLMIGETGIYHMGAWETPIGIDLRVDSLSVLLLLTINVIGFSATVYSISYMRRFTAKRRYYSLFLLMVAGMNGVVLTGDMFNLYVFMEIAAISSYALVAFGCEREELEASFKYMVLGCVASAFILIGIALAYGETGTLNMAQMANRLGAGPLSAPTMLAVALFISGFGLKAALVPFHAWLPDAHPAAPAPISAMLSGVLIKAIGVYVIIRLTFNVFGPETNLLLLLRILGTLSMVIGVLLAIGQWDMKRLFAYHSISQIGYVVLAIGLGTPLGIVGGLYHMINHSVFKSLLFLNAGAVEYATGSRDLKRMGGLSNSMPITRNTSLVASMSIAGIPPFNGFWSKLIIIFACIQAGQYWLAVAAVFVSLMTLASFLKVQRYAFFDKARSTLSEIHRIPASMAGSMIVLAILCLVLSLAVITGLETPFLITDAAEVLLNGIFTF